MKKVILLDGIPSPSTIEAIFKAEKEIKIKVSVKDILSDDYLITFKNDTKSYSTYSYIKKIRELIEDSEDEIIYILGSYLTRKKRRILFLICQDLGVTLHTVFSHCDFITLDKTFTNKDLLKDLYTMQQIPREKFDTDTYELITFEFGNYDLEKSLKIDMSHNSPYHAETIREHIKMTIDYASESKDKRLVTIAKYHDLGKAVSRRPKEIKDEASHYVKETLGQFDFYPGHENISAFYYAVEHKELTPEDKIIIEVIQQHMTKGEISFKKINKLHLTKEELSLITEFHKIDSKARKVDEKLLKTYEQLKKKNNNTK